MIWSLIASVLIATGAVDSPQRILERMRAAQAGLESLKARVEQVKSYPQLGIEDPVEKGFLYFQPGKIRLEIQEPEIRILAVKDGKYVLYQPRIRQAIFGKLEGQGTKGLFPGLLTGSAESFAELEKSYEVSDLGERPSTSFASITCRSGRGPASPSTAGRSSSSSTPALLLPVRQKCRRDEPERDHADALGHRAQCAAREEPLRGRDPGGVERIERGGAK